MKKCCRSLGRHFISQFGSRPIGSITYEELSLYLAKLPVCGKTFNNVMTPLRGVFAYAKRSGNILEDITEHIDWRKHQALDQSPWNLARCFVSLIICGPPGSRRAQTANAG